MDTTSHRQIMEEDRLDLLEEQIQTESQYFLMDIWKESTMKHRNLSKLIIMQNMMQDLRIPQLVVQ